MKLNVETLLACIGGIVMYHLFGAQLMHLRGLVDSLVLAELFSRVVAIDKKR
jgi:hypothetical protein